MKHLRLAVCTSLLLGCTATNVRPEPKRSDALRGLTHLRLEANIPIGEELFSAEKVIAQEMRNLGLRVDGLYDDLADNAPADERPVLSTWCRPVALADTQRRPLCDVELKERVTTSGERSRTIDVVVWSETATGEPTSGDIPVRVYGELVGRAIEEFKGDFRTANPSAH